MIKIKVMNLHKFKRSFQKLSLKLTTSLAGNKEKRAISEHGKECTAVCSKLLKNPNSLLLISPISGKRYIKSDENHLFIIIEANSQRLTMVNHQYSYNIDIYGRAYERITKMFDEEVERRREEMEYEIRSNVKHSLDSIYKNLLNEKV
jgi:hypothetical protein